DSGVGAGSEIPPTYDPMVAKLIVWDTDRAAATARMRRALAEFEITGLTTLLPFHQRLLATEQWARGETCRDLIEDDAWLAAGAQDEPDAEPAAPQENGTTTRQYTVEVSGRRFEVRVRGDGDAAVAAVPARGRRPRAAPRSQSPGAAHQHDGDELASPMQGTVLKIAVEPGAAVTKGTLIAIVEAMKMENEITAHKAGVVSELPIAVGASVATGDTLAVISPASD
ncbi:MAG TPA: biotin/lipoyl-containing protein, partial [Solirubrobacteraceae bacterium]|nr:biotin/lipoyl-containing protein [Solirubrobacteraceae bacterium]